MTRMARNGTYDNGVPGTKTAILTILGILATGLVLAGPVAAQLSFGTTANGSGYAGGHVEHDVHASTDAAWDVKHDVDADAEGKVDEAFDTYHELDAELEERSDWTINYSGEVRAEAEADVDDVRGDLETRAANLRGRAQAEIDGKVEMTMDAKADAEHDAESKIRTLLGLVKGTRASVQAKGEATVGTSTDLTGKVLGKARTTVNEAFDTVDDLHGSFAAELYAGLSAAFGLEM